MACDPRANPAEYKARQKAKNAQAAAICDATLTLESGPDAGIYPWKVWRVKRPEQGIAIRDYVNANTRHESTDLDISEILAGAEWPRYRGIVCQTISSLKRLLMLYFQIRQK
jgi:hypothetical protein